MKQFVVSNLAMQNIMSVEYSSGGCNIHCSTRPVQFPINSVIESHLSRASELKVILIRVQDESGNSSRSEEAFKRELDHINENIGASIEYATIDLPYDMNITAYNRLLVELIDRLEQNGELYVDMTYGPKPVSLVLFNMAIYAYRFLNMDVKNIIYGKSEFRKNAQNETVPYNTKIYDMTSFFYLSALVNKMQCSDVSARETLGMLLGMDETKDKKVKLHC